MDAKTKLSYKLEIIYNKYSPFIIALCIAISNILDYFGLHLASEGYLFVPSLLTSGHMYISRNNFKLCRFHRCFVNYVVFNVLIYIFRLHFYIFGGEFNLVFDIVTMLAFGISAVYYYIKDKLNTRIC